MKNITKFIPVFAMVSLTFMDWVRGIYNAHWF